MGFFLASRFLRLHRKFQFKKSPILSRRVVNIDDDDDVDDVPREAEFPSVHVAADEDDVFVEDEIENSASESFDDHQMSDDYDSDCPPYSPLSHTGSDTGTISPGDSHPDLSDASRHPLSELQVMLERDLAIEKEVTIINSVDRTDGLEFVEESESFLNRRFDDQFVNEYHVVYTFEEFDDVKENIDYILATLPEITVEAFRKKAARESRKTKHEAENRTLSAMGIFIRELTEFVLLGRLVSPHNFRRLAIRHRAHYVLTRGILASKLQLLHWFYVKREENVMLYKNAPIALINRQHPVIRRIVEYAMRAYLTDTKLWKREREAVVNGINKALHRTQEMVDNRQKHVRKFLSGAQKDIWTRECHALRLKIHQTLDRDQNGREVVIDWNPFDEIMFLDFPTK